jgi:non-specific serine/threonine protein kinase
MAERNDVSSREDARLFRYRFGTAEFDEAQRELRVSGLTVELEQKPMQVLALMLRHVDEVVTRQELLDAAWEGRITVDQVLTNAIAKLRKALGDETGERIVTVPRSGYKLVGPLERTSAGRRHAGNFVLKAGAPVPKREHFVLESQLGSPRENELWLARQIKTQEPRVFKFAAEGERLTALKREATLSRLLRQSLGERADLVHLLDWNFEEPPFFLEWEYGGQNLAAWAAAGSALADMPLEQRLSMFLQIADAVAAAHSVGVLHKDLKPANVLVAARRDGGWQLRIADFGNAQLLEPGRLEELGITGLGMTASQGAAGDFQSGTPLYLAPELLAGHAPTVQSDVYALGLMLFQFAVAELRRPLAPGWENDVADALLREDIAASTDGNPARRLSSAAELAERLRARETRLRQRLLVQQVQQRAADAERELERSRARRPWLIVAAVSMVAALATLAVGLTISLWLYHDEKAALRNSQRDQARAEAINRFVNDDLLGAANPDHAGRGDKTTLKEVLARAAAKLDSRILDDRDTKGNIELTLGTAYFGLGDFQNSDIFLHRAVDSLKSSRGPNDDLTLYAQYRLACDLIQIAKFGDAQALLDETDRHAGARLDQPSRIALESQIAHGDYYKMQLIAEQALPHYLAAERTYAVVAPDDQILRFNIGSALSWCYIALGRVDEAERSLHALLGPDMGAELVGPKNWLLARLSYGRIQEKLLQFGDAERTLKEAIARGRDLLGPDSVMIAAALNQLGDVYTMQNEPAAAVAPLREAYEINRKQYGDDNQATVCAKANLGIQHYLIGQFAEAADTLSAARGEATKLLGADGPISQVIAYYLASADIETGRSVDAAGLLRGLDPKRLAEGEPDGDWEPRLQALNAEIALRSGNRSEELSLLRPAVQRMVSDKLP